LTVNAAAMYLVYMGLLAAFETRMVFPAPELPDGWLAAQARAQGATELALTAEDGVALYGWHIPASGKGAVVWFEGNGGSVGMRPEEFRWIHEAGWDIVHVNYRGYPGSDGRPSEAGLRRDARAAWAFAMSVAPRAWIFGKSLGGGVAIGLAAESDPVALVVDSTFTRMTDLAQAMFPVLPVGLLMSNRFDSMALAAKVRAPVMVIHGEADDMIPVAHGHALASAFPPGATLVTLPGINHNDRSLHLVRDAILAHVGPP